MLAPYVDLKKAFDSVHLIFAESLEVLVMALEALHEEAKPLGLEVSWLKTKVHEFGGLLDETVHTRQSSTMSQRLTTTRRDMRVARTIFIIFLFVLVCSVPVAVVHGIDPTVKRPVRFLLVHILYWIQYCLNVVVYVLMNRQYRDAYVDCLGRVFPRFQRHRGFRFQWERPSVSSRPQPYLNSTKPNNHGTDSSVSEADQVVPGIPVAAGPGRLTAIPEGHSSSAANDSVFSDAQQKTPESPPTSENKNKENMYREDEKEKEDLREEEEEEEGEEEEEEERNEEKLSLMNGQHWVTKNGETISQPDGDSMV
ncbi:G-protein coupled receptor moody [Chionoecetes opilio]|uniref:G-protein coupled receptor moody n=1 Tax=Chionoecetes opilio TaxID=41210 RepID=A0A8J4YAH6_CHIOP|nr:G-protein coupled receptor moody [Chionoecetes opilio]